MIRVAGSMELSNHFCDSPFLCLPLKIGDSGRVLLFCVSQIQLQRFPLSDSLCGLLASLPLEVGDSGWEALFESQMRGFPFFLVSRIRGQSKPTALTRQTSPSSPSHPSARSARLRAFEASALAAALGFGLERSAGPSAVGRFGGSRGKGALVSPGNPEVWVKTKPPDRKDRLESFPFTRVPFWGYPIFGPTGRWLWLQKHVY